MKRLSLILIATLMIGCDGTEGENGGGGRRRRKPRQDGEGR